MSLFFFAFLRYILDSLVKINRISLSPAQALVQPCLGACSESEPIAHINN